VFSTNLALKNFLENSILIDTGFDRFVGIIQFFSDDSIFNSEDEIDSFPECQRFLIGCEFLNLLTCILHGTK
jgi:hypothetical protein